MKPIKVRLQNCDTQIGIEKDPVICWEYGAGSEGTKQKACRILLFCHDHNCYDSGWIQTRKQNNHKLKVQLKTHQRYEILVMTEDEKGNVEKSKRTEFVTGICNSSDWCGVWISNGSRKPHYVSRKIELLQQVERAYISVCGVGQYELRVNGLRPDDSVLNGSWTDYNKHMNYQTFELTDYLHTGDNTVTIELGNGWYNADIIDERHFYTLNKGYEPFGTCLAAIAVLTIQDKAGKVQMVGTGDDWSTYKSATTYTNIYGSEDYDARLEAVLELETEKAIILSKEEAPKGKLVPMQYSPVKVKRIYEGTVIKRYGQTGVLFDFGQNMSGLFEVAVVGKAGQKIRMTPVEKLDDNGDPWKITETWCHYTLKGDCDIQSWKPKFAYAAGRYLHIEAMEGEVNTRLPEIIYVRGHFITSSSEEIGDFYCSDIRYKQIHNLIIRAIESNLNHVHTDCPTIEKLGWQEPNHLMGPSIMYTKNVDNLWSKIACDLRDSQYQEEETDIDTGAYHHEYSAGLLTSIAPRYARFLVDEGEGSFWDIIPWGSSILMAAFEQYRFFGNKETLAENYRVSKKYVDYLYKKYLAYNRIYNKSSEVCFLCHGLGDWGIEQNKGESRENIETAYFYRDMILLSQIAKSLDEKEDSYYYEEIAKRVLKDYNETLLVRHPESGEWFYRAIDHNNFEIKQANQAIPIQFHMVPEDKITSVQKSFIESTKDEILRAGEIGLPYILRTLGDLKMADTVHNMIMQSNHPSYYRFIEMGETTLPEFWRDDARSRNHDMMGSILEWFYRYMAGISSEDGFQTIHIEPNLPSGVNELQCSYYAITGKIEVYYRKINNEDILLQVSIPCNTNGTLVINNNSYDMKGGISCKFSLTK